MEGYDYARSDIQDQIDGTNRITKAPIIDNDVEKMGIT